MELLTRACTKLQADLRQANASTAHNAKLQAQVAALEEWISNITKEQAFRGPTGGSSNKTWPATTNFTLNDASHRLLLSLLQLWNQSLFRVRCTFCQMFLETGDLLHAVLKVYLSLIRGHAFPSKIFV